MCFILLPFVSLLLLRSPFAPFVVASPSVASLVLYLVVFASMFVLLGVSFSAMLVYQCIVTLPRRPTPRPAGIDFSGVSGAHVGRHRRTFHPFRSPPLPGQAHHHHSTGPAARNSPCTSQTHLINVVVTICPTPVCERWARINCSASPHGFDGLGKPVLDMNPVFISQIQKTGGGVNRPDTCRPCSIYGNISRQSYNFAKGTNFIKSNQSHILVMEFLQLRDLTSNVHLSGSDSEPCVTTVGPRHPIPPSTPLETSVHVVIPARLAA